MASTTDHRSTTTRTMPRRSWVPILAAEILAGVQALFMLLHSGVNGSIVAYLGGGENARREDDPHLAAVLDYLTRLTGLWGLILLTFAITITLIPYRRGERWAWWTLWAFPLGYLLAIPAEWTAFGTDWPEVSGLFITVLYFAVPTVIGLTFGARYTRPHSPII